MTATKTRAKRLLSKKYSVERDCRSKLVNKIAKVGLSHAPKYYNPPTYPQHPYPLIPLSP